MQRHPHETAERLALRRLVASCYSVTNGRARSQDGRALDEARAVLDATRLDALGYHLSEDAFANQRPWSVTWREPPNPGNRHQGGSWFRVGGRFASQEAAARAAERDAKARGLSDLEPPSRRPVARHHRQGEA